MNTAPNSRFTVVYQDADGYFFEFTTIAHDADDARKQLEAVCGTENEEGLFIGELESIITTVKHIPPNTKTVTQDSNLVLEENDHCWITVRNASVRINDTGEGVVVDIYATDAEDAEADASTYSFFHELAQEDIVA